jgi:hypothetical protein
MAAHARRDTSSSFEIAHVLVRLNHVASFTVNANHSIMLALKSEFPYGCLGFVIRSYSCS